MWIKGASRISLLMAYQENQIYCNLFFMTATIKKISHEKQRFLEFLFNNFMLRLFFFFTQLASLRH